MGSGNLVLTLKKGEKIFIGHNTTISIADSSRVSDDFSIRIAVCAPRHVIVLREKLYKAKYDG